MIRSILIVEDEVRLRLLLASYLSYRFQAEINVVATIKDATMQMQNKKYCVIISDQNLPDGKGLALYPQSRTSGTDFILFSGELTETNFSENQGFYEIPKPKFSQLIDLLNRISSNRAKLSIKQT